MLFKNFNILLSCNVKDFDDFCLDSFCCFLESFGSKQKVPLKANESEAVKYEERSGKKFEFLIFP